MATSTNRGFAPRADEGRLITPADLYALLDAAGLWGEPFTLRRGQPLMLPGHRDRDLYYVASGTLLAATTIAGEEQCMRFGYTGDLVAVYDTWLSDAPSVFTMRALRKTVLRRARYRAYRAFLSAAPERAEIWQMMTEWLLRGMLEREIDLLTPAPEDRYLRVLERSPRLFQEVPAKYIANYLRMSPETLSRLRK